MSRAAKEDLLTAAEWLDEYESDDETGAAMRRVARWLRSEAESREVNALARANGVSAKAVRKLINRISNEK